MDISDEQPVVAGNEDVLGFQVSVAEGGGVDLRDAAKQLENQPLFLDFG